MIRAKQSFDAVIDGEVVHFSKGDTLTREQADECNAVSKGLVTVSKKKESDNDA